MKSDVFGKREKVNLVPNGFEKDLEAARGAFGQGDFLDAFDIYEQLAAFYPNKNVEVLSEVYDCYQNLPKKDRYNLYQSRLFTFRISHGDKVLDVGSGHKPFPFATHLSDIALKKHDYGRAGIPFKHVEGKPVFECDIENMPFEDQEFDFVYCSHVLEHAGDPEKACQEIMRIGKRGYIETPAKGKDIFLDSARISNHRFWVETVNGKLIFTEYTSEEIEGMRCGILMDMHCSPKTDREKAFSALIYLKPNLFNTMFIWEGEFDYEVRVLAVDRNADLKKKKSAISNTIHGVTEEAREVKKNNATSCLFIDTYYSAFLSSHYQQYPNLACESYVEQKASLHGEFFGNSDYYAEGLKNVGWDADTLIINCKQLQEAWVRENNSSAKDMMSVAVEQIRHAKPQVIYFHDLNFMTKDFLDAVRPHAKLIVGQIATVILNKIPFDSYDVLFSSFPHYVKRFREEGLTVYYRPLGFDPRILQHMDQCPFSQRPIDCSFVGGISKLHLQSYELLEYLAKETPIKFWGYGAETLNGKSTIRNRHYGHAWGKEMFTILASSKININRHGEVAENFANNMHLFEATGCGTLLITDYKDNLNNLFRIGKEIVAYRSPAECSDLVKYYLIHQDEAEAIAKAGQMRTLNNHTHVKRMRETAEILEQHLRK